MSNNTDDRSPDQFAIGEVAIAISMHGRPTTEVVIEALPSSERWLDQYGFWMPAGAYLISHGASHYRCWPTQLLKRPPAKCTETMEAVCLTR